MVEMMLATFVYPLLLQPLLLYMQRFNSSDSGSTRFLPEAFSVDVLMQQVGTYSSHHADLDADRIAEAAPAKTALFALTAVFHSLTNHPLLRLLLTALFHPLAPDSSGETMIRAKPDIAGMGPDGTIAVRTDVGLCDASVPIKMENSPYSFGNVTGERSAKDDAAISASSKVDTCVYVLSPALTEVLQGKAGDVSLMAKTRSNPYRRAVLKCLSGGPGMIPLREVAVLLLDVIVSKFETKFVSDLAFGTGLRTFSDEIPVDERRSDSRRAHAMNNRGMGGGGNLESRRALAPGGEASFMGEVVSSLCSSVTNVTCFANGKCTIEQSTRIRK